jgi:hypothetical protein
MPAGFHRQKIDLFAVMNSQVPYTLGKKAAFRVIGDPGCSAYVDLGDFKSGIDLEPVSAGVKAALGAEVIAAIKANYSETGHELTPDLLAAVEKELASREIYEGHYVVGPGKRPTVCWRRPIWSMPPADRRKCWMPSISSTLTVCRRSRRPA